MLPSRVLIGVGIQACCCAVAGAQTAHCDAIDSTAAISAVGSFSNVRYTAEHAYGYSLLLWRAGKCLFGLFESSQGLAGDTPIGTLQSIRYNAASGHIVFLAALTTGVVRATGSSALDPARDLFSLDGELHATTLTGVVTHTLTNDPATAPTHARVVLRLVRPDSALTPRARTYGEWRAIWQPILQHRGPRPGP